MASAERGFGTLGTAQALTAKERTLRAPKRVFLSALHITPALISSGRLAQGSSVVREAEREPPNLILLTADEHVQLWDNVSVRLSTPYVGLGNVLRAAHHGQGGSLLGATHGQAGSPLGATRSLFILATGLRHVYIASSPSSVDEPSQQLNLGRASDNFGLAKGFLKSRIHEDLSAAEHEELEIGVESVFSRKVINLLAEHGSNAVEALAEVLQDKLASDAVMGILLRQLGRIQQKSSHAMRRKLLSDLLRARSVQVRHAAATGLAELDDPDAIPALELARQRERHDRPREHFDLVLEQLRETRSGGSVPHR